MYALHVTYTSAVPVEALRDEQFDFAERVVGVPGFVSKTWIHSGATQGGFYLFDSREHADAFAGGPLLAGLRTVPLFSDVTVRGYEVIADLSARTGGHATASRC